MKKLCFVMLGMLMATAIGLAGCGHSSSNPGQHQSNHKVDSNGSAKDSQGRKSSDSTKENQGNLGTEQGQDDSSVSRTNQPDASTSKSHSNTHKSNHDQASNQKEDDSKNQGSSNSHAPHSSKAAFKDMMAKVHVSFQKMAPTRAPVGAHKYLTGTTASSQYHYVLHLKQTSSHTPVNSLSLKHKKDLGTISGTYYASSAKAAKQIKTINEGSNKPNMDLGHGVKAYAEGATGHAYMTWKEGRWQFQMNSPSDSHYALKGGGAEDEKKNGMEIVNYLENHRLPAPHKNGFVSISTWKNNPITKVTWREGKTIYQVKTKYAIEALKMVVSMKSY